MDLTIGLVIESRLLGSVACQHQAQAMGLRAVRLPDRWIFAGLGREERQFGDMVRDFWRDEAPGARPHNLPLRTSNSTMKVARAWAR
jgi:hypothetical protein